jgi:plasmid stability protein
MGSSLLIRNLPDDVKTELRVRAARNGRSMEEEARLILAAALGPPTRMAADGLPWSLGETVRMFFGPENGVELELPPREPARDPPDFRWVLDGPDEPEAEEGDLDPKPGR